MASRARAALRLVAARRTFAAAALLVLAAGCSRPAPRHADAVGRAGAFIRGLTDERVRIDDFFLLTLTLRLRPDWATAAVFARPADQRFPGAHSLRLFHRDHQAAGLSFERVASRASPDWPYRIPPPYAQEVYTPFDRVLLRSMYADIGDYGPADVEIAQAVRRGDGSYADTHVLAALQLVIAQGRDPGGRAAAESDQLARSVAAAQDLAATVDDLFAERIVFLYWAGHGDLVKAEWLARLVQAQRPDGAWGSGSGQGHNLHATALATLALLYHEAGATRQPLYAP